MLLLMHPLYAEEPVYPAHDAEKQGGLSLVTDAAALDGKSVNGFSINTAALTFHEIDGGTGGLAQLTISYANRGEDAASTESGRQWQKYSSGPAINRGSSDRL